MVEIVWEFIEFVKSIFSFSSFFFNDQVIFFKYGVYEVIFVMLVFIVNKDGLLVVNGSGFVICEFLCSFCKFFSDIIEFKFEFVVKFNVLEFDDSDLVLFIVVIILCGDWLGFMNVLQVEVIQDIILCVFEFYLQVNYFDVQYFFFKLLQKMVDLWQLVIEYVQMMQWIKKIEIEILLYFLFQEIYKDMY